MISFIVAMDKNNVIGYKNDMPWDIPFDLQYFKEVTMNHTIVMGRKTFESIGRVLPGRKNVVLTRQQNIEFPEGVVVINNLDEIYRWNAEQPDEEIFVIGGGELFKHTFPSVDRLYITLIDYAFEGDTYFPTFDETEWDLVKKEKGKRNDDNPYDYYFLQYDRK